MNTNRIIPTNGYVLIEPITNKEHTTTAGILLVAPNMNPPMGKIVHAGLGSTSDSPNIGDIVIYPDHVATKFIPDYARPNEFLHLLEKKFVMAVIPSEE
jgi:co-chaperonin GroES (HSP10)